MRHFKYTPPINGWATKSRQTVQVMFQWGVKPEAPPRLAGGVRYMKFSRKVWHSGRKPSRIAVGFVRAMGSMQFFRGCYEGAEND